MGDAPKQEDVKMDDQADVKKEEDAADVEMKEEEDGDKEPPKAELTEEEKNVLFRQRDVKDLLVNVLNSSFAQFSLPTKDEGFSEIHYEWHDEATCKAYFRAWMLEKKKTTKIEDIQPSAAFQTRLEAWQKHLQEWQGKQSECKKKQAAAKAAK